MIPLGRRSAFLLRTMVASAALVVAPRAIAQESVFTAAYDDAKDVISLLLEKEAAESLVPNLACYAPPGVLVYFPQTLQYAYDRQLGSLPQALRTEAADLAGSVIHRAAIGAAEPSVNALMKVSDWQDSFQDSVTPLPACRDEIRGKGGPRWYLEWRQAGSGKTHQKEIATCLGATKTAVSARFACDLGLAARSAVLKNEADSEGHLLRAVALLIYASTEPSSADGSSNPPAVDEAALGRLTSALLSKIQGKEVTIEPLTPHGERLLSLAANLWAAATSGGTRRLDLRTALVHVLLAMRTQVPASEGSGPNDCGQSPSVVGVALDRIREAMEGGEEFRQLVDAVTRGDAADVAARVIQSAVRTADRPARQNAGATEDEVNKAEQSTSAREATAKVYGRFAMALAVYTLEVDARGGASQAAREAFRNAAAELLMQEGVLTGFDRPALRSYGWLYPSFALRASFSQGYLNQSSPQGFRVAPTVGWPKLLVPLRYTDQAYAGLQIGIFDVLGPFTDVATRNEHLARAPGAEKGYLNLVRPSLDVVGGLPGLSRHIAVSAGVSWRLASAFESEGRFSYQTFWECAPVICQSHRAGYYPSFMEGSIALQYIP